MNLETRNRNDEKGSALVLALFTLMLLGSMGAALLFMSVAEVRMSRASLRVNTAFYLAEAGLEDGRARLYDVNGPGEFSDDLVVAAGANGVIDFDPANLVAVHDGAGNFTGFGGYGDDVPLRPATMLAGSWHGAFLTNDPIEPGSLADNNDRVMITGVSATPDNSFEIVQGIVEREFLFPSVPPATITLLGPSPAFEGPHSDPKVFDGQDCGGAGSGVEVPVVGTIGSAAETSAEAGIYPNPVYTSGGYSDEETFADLTDPLEPTVVASGYGTIDPIWTDCQELHDMVEVVRVIADVVCTNNACALPPAAPDRVVFVDGDYDIGSNDDGQGLLLVTGALTFHGGATWNGLVYVIGEGQFTRSGGGSGTISGATLVADIAGPDNTYGTADDCTGGDGGFDSVLYDEDGGGTSSTVYCTLDFMLANPAKPYKVVEFVQR